MTLTPFAAIVARHALRACATLVDMIRPPAPRTVVRDRGHERRVRAQRVERLGIPFCRMCGGATGEPEDITLRCDCDDVRHELVQRAASLANEHRGADHRVLADVIAP